MASPAENADAGPAVPGAVLAGKYRVERILGQGGMGIVVEAKHLALDERVALKFLLPELVQNADAAARFVREARAAVKIKSEHVARVSDVGTLETGAPYMVMEFLHGSDLGHLVDKQGALDVPDAIDFILQGCEAIAEAHSYGIVHRDLKPANLFLTRRPDGSPLVKVLDFGISKNMQGVDNLTKTTTAMGSALYMSPEQMQQARTVDHRTDIYALGITLYELITGRVPFFADSLPQLCAAILTGEPTPLRQVRPDVPEHLVGVIARAYARDLNQRYQTIAELVCALAPYAPPRSQPSLDRIARMAGLEPSVAGRASIPPAAPAAPQDTSSWSGNRGSRGPTQQLPAATEEARQVGHESSGQILVPGYAGPVSVKASAAFAASAMRHNTTTSSGKIMFFAFVGLAVLAFIGVAAVVLLRGARPALQPEGALSAQAGSPPVLAPSEPPATPSSIVEPASSATSAPVVSSASSPPLDTAMPPAGKALPPGTTLTPATARQPVSKSSTAPQGGAPGKPTNAPPPVLTAR